MRRLRRTVPWEEDVMTLVALSIDGRYLTLADDGLGRLVAGTTLLAAADVFRRVDLGHGRIALRTLDGGYLTMLPDPGQNFGLYRTADLTPAAAFEEILWPTGQVSLRSAELTYVAVDGPDRVVTVNRVEAPLNARFTYVRPPGVVPEQRAPYAPDREAVPPARDPGRGLRR